MVTNTFWDGGMINRKTDFTAIFNGQSESPIGASLGNTEFSLAKIWSKEITRRLSHIYFAKVFAQVIWPQAFLSSYKG